MKNFKVDLLNIVLIIVALVLAILLPFELFLLTYAFIGPLHYLTEINWLEQKNYFMPSKRLFVPLVIVAMLVVLPKTLGFVGITNPAIDWINNWSNVLLFGALAFSFAWIISNQIIVRSVVLIALLITGALLKDQPLFLLVVGALLPTLIHVYLFTGLFMLSGALKSKNYLGILSVVLLAAIPFIVANLQVDPDIYTFSNTTKERYAMNGFGEVIIQIQRWLDTGNARFLFYDPNIIRFQIFIAFAYFYHYLNWFSKTGIIGWGKALTGVRTYIVLGLWAICSALFLFDYRIGFMSSLLLSFLHVTLEFPLNIVSIRTIFLAPLPFFKK